MKAYITESKGEYDIRFSRPISESREVILSYDQRDRILTCTMEEVQYTIRSILIANKLLGENDK